MIIARDNGAHFDGTVEPIGGRFQARWTVLIVGGPIGQSETDVRDFDREADAWAWIDVEAARRGFHRNVDVGPQYEAPKGET
jgi:hypothetical protein